jgi:hypothetical protein
VGCVSSSSKRNRFCRLKLVHAKFHKSLASASDPQIRAAVVLVEDAAHQFIVLTFEQYWESTVPCGIVWLPRVTGVTCASLRVAGHAHTSVSWLSVLDFFFVVTCSTRVIFPTYACCYALSHMKSKWHCPPSSAHRCYVCLDCCLYGRSQS